MIGIVAPSRMEPVRIEEYGDALADLALDLATAADRMGRALAPATLDQVATMIRVMNSYYSNRIECNNTRPRDIERALAGDFSVDPERRRLQQENAAHVRIQADIDARAVENRLGDPTSPDFLRGLHRAFYRDADPAALVIEHSGQSERLVPGSGATGIWRSAITLRRRTTGFRRSWTTSISVFASTGCPGARPASSRWRRRTTA